jgi:hypothetical protein
LAEREGEVEAELRGMGRGRGGRVTAPHGKAGIGLDLSQSARARDKV